MMQKIVDEVAVFDSTDLEGESIEISNNMPGENFPSLFIEVKGAYDANDGTSSVGICNRAEGVRMIEHMAKMLGYSVELTDTWARDEEED